MLTRTEEVPSAGLKQRGASPPQPSDLQLCLRARTWGKPWDTRHRPRPIRAVPSSHDCKQIAQGPRPAPRTLSPVTKTLPF